MEDNKIISIYDIELKKSDNSYLIDPILLIYIIVAIFFIFFILILNK